MFTDMVGYTAIGQRNEALSLSLLDEQRKLVRPILGRHHGREVKTVGDAFLVDFPSALDAVRCAYDVQRAIREFNFSQPSDQRVNLRIGIHLGDVTESENDISGDAVNIASRIEALGKEGDVCVTRQVYDHVQNKFELPLQSLGQKTLKNVLAPLEIFRLVMPWEKLNDLTPTQLDKRRIAVLPFANISQDPNDEYFADGMTEELISSLSSIAELTVIARTSVMRYKQTTKGVDEIGKELNAGSVLEGSVRKAGERPRVTAQLIDSQTQGHLWSESYDREMKDIFAVQMEIAKHVADASKLKLLAKEMRLIKDRGTDSPDAYSFYLKGRYYWNERTEDALRKSITYFEKAIEKAPNYALAYAGLADTYSILADFGLLAPSEGLPKARFYATRAVELDENLPEAHVSLAPIHYHDWDFNGALKELRKAIELKPGLATAHHWYAIGLKTVGRAEEAITEILHARELDPYSPQINVAVGSLYFAARQYEKAVSEFKEISKIFPHFWNAHDYLGITLVKLSRFEEGLSELRLALSLSKDSYLAIEDLAIGYALAGKPEMARAELEKLKQISHEHYVSPDDFARIHAALGEKEKAIEWLEKAYDERSTGLPHLAEDPIINDILGDDEGYIRILKKIGLRR
jgi:adenylate cyclase